MDRSGLLQKLDHRPDQAVRIDVHAGDTIDLTDQDRQRDAGEESGQDRARQEVRKTPSRSAHAAR